MIEVSEATYADMPRLDEMARELFAQSAPLTGMALNEDGLWGWWQDTLADGNWLHVIASNGAADVGYASFNSQLFPWCHEPMLVNVHLYARPAYRGHGVGRLLLRAGFAWGLSRGIKACMMGDNSGVSDAGGMSLFSGFGLQKCGAVYAGQIDQGV